MGGIADLVRAPQYVQHQFCAEGCFVSRAEKFGIPLHLPIA